MNGSRIRCRGQSTDGGRPAWLLGVAVEPQYAICYGVLQKASNYNGFIYFYQDWDQWQVSVEVLMNHQDL
jgi:hypothetical protein